LPVHYGVVHYGRDPKKTERNRKKSDQVKPLPFIDGIPREPIQPPAEDDLLLQRGIDGF